MYQYIRYSSVIPEEIKQVLYRGLPPSAPFKDFGVSNGRVHYTDQRGRITTVKAGKGLKRYYEAIRLTGDPEVPEWVLSKFAEEITDLEGVRFLTVVGQDITDVYNCELYIEGTYYSKHKSFVDCSCMELHDCDVTEIYRINPERVGLCICLYKDTIMGRCLVWLADDGNIYHDYIYSSQLVVKDFEEYFLKLQIEHINTRDNTVSPIHTIVCSYPYIDSLKYVKICTEGSLSTNYKMGSEICREESGQTCSGTGESAGVYSDYHNGEIDRDDAVYSDYLDSYIDIHCAVEYEGDYFPIEECTNVGGTYIPDSLEGEEWGRCFNSGEEYLIENLYICEYDFEQYHLDTGVYIEATGATVFEDNVEAYADDNDLEKIEGEWVEMETT